MNRLLYMLRNTKYVMWTFNKKTIKAYITNICLLNLIFIMLIIVMLTIIRGVYHVIIILRLRWATNKEKMVNLNLIQVKTRKQKIRSGFTGKGLILIKPKIIRNLRKVQKQHCHLAQTLHYDYKAHSNKREE